MEIAREFFPYSSDRELDYIIWEKTGFPYFWPDGSRTVEENLRTQLMVEVYNVIGSYCY
jgi:hypothetical protein